MPTDPKPWYENLRVDLDPERIDENLDALGQKLRRAMEQGWYTRVRFKYKGRPLLPDIPLGALVATEVATFWWAGPIRALVMNLGVKTLLEVEFLHAADDKVREGQEAFMNGDVTAAESAYREALRMRPGDIGANYNLGVLLRVSGRREEATLCLTEAARVPDHPEGSKARELLSRMKSP